MNYIHASCCFCHLPGPWFFFCLLQGRLQSLIHVSQAHVGKKRENMAAVCIKFRCLQSIKLRTFLSLFVETNMKLFQPFSHGKALSPGLTSHLELSCCTKGTHQFIPYDMSVLRLEDAEWRSGIRHDKASKIDCKLMLSWSFQTAFHVSYSPCLPVLNWFNVPSCNFRHICNSWIFHCHVLLKMSTIEFSTSWVCHESKNDLFKTIVALQHFQLMPWFAADHYWDSMLRIHRINQIHQIVFDSSNL